MEGKLLTPNSSPNWPTWAVFPRLQTISEKNTCYADALNTLEEDQIHRGNIEKVLTQSLYHDYTKLYRFCGQKQRRFMRLILKNYEIDLITTVCVL